MTCGSYCCIDAPNRELGTFLLLPDPRIIPSWEHGDIVLGDLVPPHGLENTLTIGVLR